jgi:hypothetical protein
MPLYINKLGQGNGDFECFLMDNLNIDERFIESKNKKALCSALKNNMLYHKCALIVAENSVLHKT